MAAAATTRGTRAKASWIASKRPLEFSRDARYLAYSGPDGRLKIWETSTGILRQEYTPSSHLSAMCTCLAWDPTSNIETTTVEMPITKSKAKRRKSSAVEITTQNLDLLALGTLKGNILLYSVTKGDLQSEMTGGHSDAVNCICWNTVDDSLFSCSEDCHIIEWSLSKGNVKSKWKANVGSVCSLAILPDGKTLLSAGKTIQWWDLETKRILKTFSGHVSNVLQLKVISFRDEPPENGYFVSAANGDRLISAWQFKSPDKNSLASFTLTDEPVAIDVSKLTSRSEKVILAALTKGGVLHLFEHQLNGKCRKPLKPKVTLQIGTSGNAETSRPVPVLSTKICGDGNDKDVVFAYGDFLKVGFEKMKCDSLAENMCLVRDLHSSVNKDGRKSATKVMTPNVPNDAKVLAPGHLVSSRPTQQETSSPQKRKLEDGEEVKTQRQLPMEDRLSALSLDLPGRTDGSVKLSLDNVAHLLVQGLHGQDENILNKVFEVFDRDVIDKTVSRLPAEVVVVILKELHQRIHVKPDRSLAHLCWVRSILTHHTSYLSTCSTLDTILGPLYQLFDSRITLFEKMSRLKGRMDLVMTQLDTQREFSAGASMNALCVYQDESSDEADSYIDDLLPSHSESEADNWDEFSEPEDMELDENAEKNIEDGDESNNDSN